MSTHAARRMLALLGGFALAACANAQDPSAQFAGLDMDGDGLLRPADLAPGTAGVYLWRTRVDEEPVEEAHRCPEAEVFFNTAANNWVFRAPLQGVPEYVLHVPFDPDSGASGPSIGASALLGVSIDVPAREHGGQVEPGGDFNLTESGETASGWVELDALVVMQSYVQQAETGETLRFAGIAFSTVEVSR